MEKRGMLSSLRAVRAKQEGSSATLEVPQYLKVLSIMRHIIGILCKVYSISYHPLPSAS